jgi:hypothetical protein
MKKKIIGIFVSMLLIMTVLSGSGTGTVEKSSIPVSSLNNQGPVLKAEIVRHFGLFAIIVEIENIGNQTAHNVTISDYSFVGNVIYNYREPIGNPVIEPGGVGHSAVGIFMGFRKFTVTVTVTCDESVSDTTSAMGFAFALWCFIP